MTMSDVEKAEEFMTRQEDHSVAQYTNAQMAVRAKMSLAMVDAMKAGISMLDTMELARLLALAQLQKLDYAIIRADAEEALTFFQGLPPDEVSSQEERLARKDRLGGTK